MWRLTFLELHWLTQEWRRGQERDDRRAALGAMLLANVHRDSEARSTPFSLHEVVSWLGHGFQREAGPVVEEAPEPPTALELEDRMQALAELYNSTSS